MTGAQHRAAEAISDANEAASLIEKLAPVFAKLEEEAIEAALAASYWQPEGGREARHHLDQARAIRALRDRLKTKISLGRIAAGRNPS